MGISITATNPKHTFDMGYGGFFNLRKSIALAMDEEFGANYELLANCSTEEEYAENDKKANEIIARNHLGENHPDILDFLYAPDTEGSISYRTCGEIYKLIKDVDFGMRGFCYAAYSRNDYERFKSFLKDCYSHHKKMRWY